MWFTISFIVLVLFMVLGTQGIVYSGAFFGLYQIYNQDRPLTKDLWLGFISLMAGVGSLCLSYSVFLLSGVRK